MTSTTTNHFWSHLAHLRENRFRAMMTAFYVSIIFCLIMLIFTDQVNKHRTTPLPQSASSESQTASKLTTASAAINSTSQATTSTISPSSSYHSRIHSTNGSFFYHYAFSRKLHPVLTWSIAALILLAFILANILTNWKCTRQTLWLFLPLIALFAITKTLAICYIRLL